MITPDVVGYDDLYSNPLSCFMIHSIASFHSVDNHSMVSQKLLNSTTIFSQVNRENPRERELIATKTDDN